MGKHNNHLSPVQYLVEILASPAASSNPFTETLPNFYLLSKAISRVTFLHFNVYLDISSWLPCHHL